MRSGEFRKQMGRARWGRQAGYVISEGRRDGTPKKEDDLQGMGEGAGGGGGTGGWESLGSEPHKALSTD